MRRPMTQDEYVRHIWNTQSRWGIRRRNRTIRSVCIFGAGAAIGMLVVHLLLR